ncbi:MAG: hypothetical protein KKH95_02230 [Gammaproteobacteria bacterium]|nr:hypothetical protein [Gammaproteobacteria bacterium]
MPEFGVSEFSYLAAGDSEKRRKSKLKTISQRGGYEHYKDYYRALRVAIKSVVKGNKPFSHLEQVAKKQNDSSKQAKYRKKIAAYGTWREGKNVDSYSELSNKYRFMNTVINCNPELNLNVDGRRKLIKLYFNESESMTQDRANVICALMKEVVGGDGYDCLVLDLTSNRELEFFGDHYLVMDKIHAKIIEIEGWRDGLFVD